LPDSTTIRRTRALRAEIRDVLDFDPAAIDSDLEIMLDEFCKAFAPRVLPVEFNEAIRAVRRERPATLRGPRRG
jgi:hypothetical protein